RAGTAFIATGSGKVRLDHVDWLEESPGAGGPFVRVADDRWMRASDLRRPSVAAPPPEVDSPAGERWIDVDLAGQTLVAYEGARPVFATLVSTGRGKPGSALGTPLGTHRIWVKLLGATMDNLEDPGAANYYRIEDVPYVQFFSKGVGLHAAFWHRNFGRVRSHGCVNLAPRDAAFLFDFTGPRVPAGWSAALPTSHDAGTVVRVR
ncbi:MAG: L,D-transpeptidase, partial [Deltaproteobacteria bacterium]|nr:L,D-transpeptidase [Deltaproteobacteria bacterium]